MRLVKAASLATLLGALMGAFAFMVDGWLDRKTNYWLGPSGDRLIEFMTFAGAVIGGFFGLFIGGVIGIIEMPRSGAALTGLIAGFLAATWAFASGASTEGFYGVLGLLQIPAGAVIGLCSGAWANRKPRPRPAAEDEPKSGSIFNLDDHLEHRD